MGISSSWRTRVETGVPVPTRDRYNGDAVHGGKQSIISKTSAAGGGSSMHAAGLPEEEAAADEEDDEDMMGSWRWVDLLLIERAMI